MQVQSGSFLAFKTNINMTLARTERTLRSHDLHVQVRQAAGRGQRQLDHALHRHRVAVQIVEQRAVLVIVWHQPQLRPRAVIWDENETGHY